MAQKDSASNLGFMKIAAIAERLASRYGPCASASVTTMVQDSMHSAASRFARVAAEGERGRALVALREVSAACVACHRGYKLR